MYQVISNFQWTAPDGTQRFFPISTQEQISGTGCPDHPGASGPANDSSGYRMVVTNYVQATVYAPDGSQVYPSVKDTNGNFFSKDGSGNVIDTLGRTPITKTSNCNSNSNQTCYNVLNSQGGRSTFTITTESISVSTSFGVSGVTEYSGSLTVIQSIKLPDNTMYQFGYDSYGEVSSITLPTGGLVTYTYTIFFDSFGGVNRWPTVRNSGGGGWGYSPQVITTCAPGTVGCQQKVTVRTPANIDTVYTFTLNNGAWTAQVDSYNGISGASALLSTLTSTWNFSNACSPTPCTGNSNIQKMSQTLTLPVPSGSVTKTTQYAYDSISDMNVTSVKEWKFYSGGQPATPDRETDFTYLTNSAYTLKNIINRVLSSTIKDGAGNVVAQTTFSYDDSGTLSNSTPATGIANHDDSNYGISNTTRGNLSKVQRCTSSAACATSYLQRVMISDTTGQVLSIQDPNSSITTFGYGDRFFTDGSPASNPPQSYAPPAPTNAYLTSVTRPLVGASSFGYYFWTGKRASSTDPNGADSYMHFLDPYSLDRLTHAYGPIAPNGNRPWSLYVYSPTQTQVDSYLGINDATPSSSCTSCQHREVISDNLGRVVHAYLVNDPEGQTVVDTSYDTAGRVQNSSHPYRSISDSTYGLESPTYGGLNRAIKITHPDGTYVQLFYGADVGSGGRTTQACSSSTYGLGFPTLSVDEAGKKREVWTDGFGATIETDEPDPSGNLSSGTATCYGHDTLGNVTSVLQNGSRQRTYVYDALSRLTGETTPEGGAITYNYNSNGDISSKIAPAPNQTGSSTVTTSYSWDALHRLTQKSYSDGTTPTASFYYDLAAPWGSPYGGSYKGRLSQADTVDSTGHYVASTIFVYDALGRITISGLCTAVNCGLVGFHTSYSYDLAGNVTSYSTSENGITFSYQYDAVGRPSAVTSSLVDANHPATLAAVDSSVGYYPHGALRKMLFGNGLTFTSVYNNRLQPCLLDVNNNGTTLQTCNDSTPTGNVLDLWMGYSNNNGNVTNWNATGAQSFVRTYGYDSLNRLSTLSSPSDPSGCTGLSWSYDFWGNRTDQNVTGGTCGQFHATVNTLNQLVGPPYQYDAAGNLTYDGSHSYTYDAENRLTQVDGGATARYGYDALGKRVQKTTGAAITQYVHDMGGQVILEMDGNGNGSPVADYIYLAGSLIAEYKNGTTYFVHTDHLGSTRIVTGLNQGVVQSVDYLPFGELNSSDSGVSTHEFTGLERDSETSLDQTLFRKYSSSFGRWMTPDPLKSLNRYSYAANNPLNLTDPLGLVPCGETKFGANPQFCNSSPGGDLGCTLDGVVTGCRTIYILANAGALEGVSAPLPGGQGNALTIWLPGGSIRYTDYGDWGDMVGYSSGLLLSFNGEWVTLTQYLGYIQDYYNHLGNLSDDQRLRIVARGVVRGAGVVGDWRYVAGFYAASLGSAAIDAVIADYAAGPLESTLFGRFNPEQGGGFPGFLNDPSYPIRLGYGWNGKIGQMVFRLSIDALGHVDFWTVPFP